MTTFFVLLIPLTIFIVLCFALGTNEAQRINNMSAEELEEEQRRKEAKEQNRKRRQAHQDPNTRLLRNILWIDFLRFMRKK